MKRGVIVICVFLVLILSLSLVSASWFSDFWGKITGKITNDSSARICVDSDGGKEIYTKGTVSYTTNRQRNYTDYCDKKGKKLREYYCDDKNREKSKVYKCENGCVEGACVNKINLEHCKEVIPNHNNLNENRINIVFIAGGVNSLTPNENFDFKNLFKAMINGDGSEELFKAEGLKGIEPFSSNINKFNFWYVDTPLFGEDDPCNYIILPTDATCSSGYLWQGSSGYSLDSSYMIYQNSNLKNYCSLPNKYIHIFYKSNNYISSSHSGWGGYSESDLVFGLDNPYYYLAFNVFVHEFTHSFAEVYDEKGSYFGNTQDDAFIGPNCFSLGKENEIDAVECSKNSLLPWQDLIGNGCGKEGIVDCPVRSNSRYNRSDEWVYEVRDDVEGCLPGCAYIQNNIFSPFIINNVMNLNEVATKRFNLLGLDGYINKLGVINEREACRKIRKLVKMTSIYCEKLCLNGCEFGKRCVQGKCISKELIK